MYLRAYKFTIRYADIKQVVKKVYQYFGKPSHFNDLPNQPFSHPLTLV